MFSLESLAVVLLLLTAIAVEAGPRTPCYSPETQLWKTSQLVIRGTFSSVQSLDVDYSEGWDVASYRYFQWKVRVDQILRSYAGPAGNNEPFAAPEVGEEINVVGWYARTLLPDVDRELRGVDNVPRLDNATTTANTTQRQFDVFLHYERFPEQLLQGMRGDAEFAAMRWPGKSYLVNFPAGIQPTGFAEQHRPQENATCYGTECTEADAYNIMDCKGYPTAFPQKDFELHTSQLLRFPQVWMNPEDPAPPVEQLRRRHEEFNASIDEIYNEYVWVDPDDYGPYGCLHTNYSQTPFPGPFPISGYILPIDFCLVTQQATNPRLGNISTAEAAYLWQLSDILNGPVTRLAVYVWDPYAFRFAIRSVLPSWQSLRIFKYFRYLVRNDNSSTLAAGNFLYFNVPSTDFNSPYVLSAAGQTHIHYRDMATCDLPTASKCIAEIRFRPAQLDCQSDDLLDSYFLECANATGGCYAFAVAQLYQHITANSTYYPNCTQSAEIMKTRIAKAVTRAGGEHFRRAAAAAPLNRPPITFAPPVTPPSVEVSFGSYISVTGSGATHSGPLCVFLLTISVSIALMF